MSNRPQPVISSASITAALHAAVLVLGWLGLDNAKNIVSTQTSAIVAVVIGLVTIVAHVLPALHVASKVTPKNSPQADDGTPLVPVTDTATSTAVVAVAPDVATSPEPIIVADDDPTPDPVAAPVAAPVV